jgi:hypothetical protein
MIICSKSRRTWFCAGDGNPRPGTVVDRDVTSVYDFDFYLQGSSVELESEPSSFI